MTTLLRLLATFSLLLGSSHSRNTIPQLLPGYGRMDTESRNDQDLSELDNRDELEGRLGRRHESRRYQPNMHPFQQPVQQEDVQLTPSYQNDFEEVAGWPASPLKLGQISAVTFDTSGNVVVFHRGDHVWDASTFDNSDTYLKKDEGPIEKNTIITLHPDSGQIIHQWGANLFFIPHGITIDGSGNIFLTDVALHQVFKFPPKGGNGKPLMVLGTRFEHGADRNHFCKPTAVAVTKSGDFFVADGYCNHRIIKFNSKGEFLMQFGQRSYTLDPDRMKPPPPSAFSVPHALALIEDKNLISVADRENGRIQIFRINNGSYAGQIKLREFGRRLFSISYTPLQGGMLFAVNGPDFYDASIPVRGFAIGISSHQVVSTFGNFKNPHDLAVSYDGREVYVVEISPYKISKFIDKRSGNTTVQRVEFPAEPENKAPPAIEVTESPRQFLPMIEESPHVLPQSVEALIVIAALVSISMVAVIFVLVRKRGRGPCCYWFCNNKWHVGRTPAETFKLGHLLDPHSGFELVGQEMSDEEIDDESDSLANSFATKA